MSSDSPTDRELLLEILWRLGRIEQRLEKGASQVPQPERSSPIRPRLKQRPPTKGSRGPVSGTGSVVKRKTTTDQIARLARYGTPSGFLRTGETEAPEKSSTPEH
jgi:hypothetical protein